MTVHAEHPYLIMLHTEKNIEQNKAKDHAVKTYINFLKQKTRTEQSSIIP